MTHISYSLTTLSLVRPALAQWFEKVGAQWQAWGERRHARRLWRDQERALRGLDRRTLKDLGFSEPIETVQDAADLRLRLFQIL